MTQIQSTTDLTGALSQTDLNTADIQNIIDEFNKFNDQYTGGNIQQNQQNIIVFDDQTNRVLIGYQTVLEQWGLFVSQVGVDVTEATATQLLFNSNQNVLQVVTPKTTVTLPGSSIINSGAGTGAVTIAHGLSYEPALLSSAFVPILTAALATVNANVPLQYNSGLFNPYIGTGTASATINIFAGVDATNIYFSYFAAGSGTGTTTIPDITVTYYLLSQSIN